jgi:hypothetical protein
MNEAEQRRQRRNANLELFTSENQPPGWKKSRKGIPNRSTVLKLAMKELEKREKRKARKRNRLKED